jgi:hypothetical protein
VYRELTATRIRKPQIPDLIGLVSSFQNKKVFELTMALRRYLQLRLPFVPRPWFYLPLLSTALYVSSIFNILNRERKKETDRHPYSLRYEYGLESECRKAWNQIDIPETRELCLQHLSQRLKTLLYVDNIRTGLIDSSLLPFCFLPIRCH